jgi:UDP-2,3-diacylglucosamine pyrophosphatase LpxH
MRVRSVFISDVHLGHRGSRANELLAYLAEVDARNIFVIGDLVDFWALGKSVCWPQAHQDVLRTLVERARSGVRVVYIPGNHDDAAREFAGMNICGIEVRRQHVHVTADGRRMLLLHGDEFDAAVRYGRWRVILGSVIYGIALRINHLVYLARRAIGLGEWSLTAWLKRQVAGARAYIALFEEAAAERARRENCDGVVCGHIHHAAVREIDGVLYCNDGDWVESCSSLVEGMNGKLSLVYWSDLRVAARASSRIALDPIRNVAGVAQPIPQIRSANSR